MAVIVMMAMMSLPTPVVEDLRDLIITPGDSEELETSDELEELVDEPVDIDVTVAELLPAPSVATDAMPVATEDLSAASTMIEIDPVGLQTGPASDDLVRSVAGIAGDAFSGRSGAARQQLAAKAGATDASEAAVARGLRWLAAHQLPDGSWSFNHLKAPACRGQCRNPGEYDNARNGATAMALLPFLGAGQTHRDGQYKNEVGAGLLYLIKSMKFDRSGGSLIDAGNMYSHGLSSIALCESYAMTRDKNLQAPAQQAINFICSAQDPAGGGWRYHPRQAGDTSVVGWQLMALKSGHMGYLRIPAITIAKASLYLNSVQANNGANYGYTTPGTGPATTAIGLLCRMQLGWKKDHPALQRGAKFLSDKGPDKKNMYFNYYATQVLRHLEGPMWEKWNTAMRDQLVATQAKDGHQDGSWFFGETHHSEKGGRLYDTCMATMVLEVYYRHLPIYSKMSTEDVFPLE
jgi:hypothetical protein